MQNYIFLLLVLLTQVSHTNAQQIPSSMTRQRLQARATPPTTVAEPLDISDGDAPTEADATPPTEANASLGYRAQERPSEIVDFDAFMAIAAEAQEHRRNRLVNLDTWLAMSKEPNTVILDTRSDNMYEMKHIKGAMHINFSDFTTETLHSHLKSPDTRILIYCNNNIEGDNRFFASKMAPPNYKTYLGPKKPVSLALNIPTFINLYGYGYTNIYELESIVAVYDARLTFEGKAVVEEEKRMLSARKKDAQSSQKKGARK